MGDERDQLDRDLVALDAELKRLDVEFTQFFAGRRPRPPLDTRARVQAMVRKLDRTHIQNYGDRFRFSSLQSRVVKCIELWDRGLRAREEGRDGPFSRASMSPNGRNVGES